MKRLATTRAIFLASMVFASGAFAAGTEIKKCVTESGHVTLTDEACPSGSQAVKIITAPASATAETRDAVPAPRAVVAERYTVPRMPTRYATLMKSARPARGLALDVSTLRAARATLQQFDSATESLRSQRIAALQ